MPKNSKTKGVSRSVRVVATSGTGTSSSRLAPTNVRKLNQEAMARDRDAARQRYLQHLTGLSEDSRRVVAEMRGEDEPVFQTSADDDSHLEHMDWQPVEEGLQGDRSFTAAIRETIGQRNAKPRVYKDGRTWRRRLARLNANWEPLMPELTQAYLTWKYEPFDRTSANPSGPPSADPSGPHGENEYDFDIEVVDLYTLSSSAHIRRTEDMKTPEALVLSGYLGTSPVSPTLALSLKTLELFRRLRLRKASFSVEAFAKVLCDLYNIPFRRRYRSALSDTFDIYLAIHRNIDKQVTQALGRDTPNWRVLNACPPCSYELNDESPLKFRRMFAIDGNNSLKRIAHVGDCAIGDLRVFEDSDYFLPRSFVDSFSGEVCPRQAAHDDAKADMDGDSDHEWFDTSEGDPTDGCPDDDTIPCTDKWKAAAADDKKRMWGVFEETGIFAGACRHGLMLWVADMVRSGELAKYPLAITSKALDVLGDGLLEGYDIGCSFSSTIASSSLREKAERLNFRCCVNAFHGYSHNFGCQMKNHPNIIDGTGLEDLEVMERIFGGSNSLAPVTRYATAFRRRVLIDLYFRQWDEEKYQNLGLWLYNNYVQASKIIKEEGYAPAEAMRSMGIEGISQLEQWHREEVEYFSKLGREPEWDVHAIAYVEHLQELRELEARYDNSSTRFLTATPSDYQFSARFDIPGSSSTYDHDTSKTRRLETERRYADERRRALLQDVIAMEVKMGIINRWLPSSPEYMKTLQYMSTRKYHKALDNLQRLIIQRLFELHKMNQSQNGYRMRTHIAKALQTRSKAIQNAVKAYNTAAAALNPPQRTIDWSEVSHYHFLEEFHLLRDTRQDIRNKRWAQPAIREAIKQSLKIAHARGEIERCNIEIRRLHTAILDEHKFFEKVLPELRARGDRITGAVEEYITRRRRINAHLLARLSQIYDLEDFCGNKLRGVRKGHVGNVHEEATLSESEAEECGELNRDDDDDDDDDEEEDEYAEGLVNLVDFVSELAVAK